MASKRKNENQVLGTKSASELVWLLGQPQLSDYLDFVRTKVVGGAELNQRELAAEWRAANDIYAELETSEAGLADQIRTKAIGRAVKPLAARLQDNAWFRASFDNLPYTIELVELDKLMVSQDHVERSFTRQFVKRLQAMSEQELFNYCLPVDKPMPPVEVTRLSGDRYVFTSPSTDFRSHSPRLLRPAEIPGVTSSGPISAFVGIAVGFGSNFLSAVRSDKRIVLQNGYHRAYALRSAGLTHAYCVIEDVTRKDELRLTADETVAGDPEFYFAARRPPLLKDFFDKRFAKRMYVRPMVNHIEVEIKVRSGMATAWE